MQRDTRIRALKVLSCANIPELILVSAHFSGLMRRTVERDLRKDSPSKIRRGDDYIRQHWKSMEELVTEFFHVILLAMPPKELGRLVARLFHLEAAMPLFVVDLVWKQDFSQVIGDPDIVLCDESKKQFFLIELKIQAKKNNGKFSLQQHTKYSNYIQALEVEGKTGRAMLLAPSDNYRSCISSHEVAWFDYVDGTLLPDKNRIDGKPAYVANKKVHDFPSFIEYHNKSINAYGLDVKADEYRKIEYRSFSNFKEALALAAPHLVGAFSEIEKECSPP